MARALLVPRAMAHPGPSFAAHPPRPWGAAIALGCIALAGVVCGVTPDAHAQARPPTSPSTSPAASPTQPSSQPQTAPPSPAAAATAGATAPTPAAAVPPPPPLLQGQRVTVRTMTLEQALAYARTHHPRLAAAQAEIAVREREARVPAARYLPRLGATVQAIVGSNNSSAAAWFSSGGAVEFPRISGTAYLQQPTEVNWYPYMNTAVGVGLEQRVFDFGRVAAESAIADALTRVARHRADEDRLRTDLAVREAYFAVLAARSVETAADDAVVRATAHRDAARALVDARLRPRIELERAEADLSRFEVGRIRAQGGVRIAQSVFAAAVGLDDALLDANAANDSLPPPLPPLEEAVRRGDARDPAVLAARAQLRAQQAQTRLLDAEQLPEIRLVATVMGAAGGAPAVHMNVGAFGLGFVPWVPDYFAGLVFQWRFFDPVLQARRGAARQAEQVAGARIMEIRQEQTAVIQQAWIAVNVAQRALPALEHALSAAQSNYAQAEARFHAGLGTSVEIADAEALRTDAEIQLALGRFQIARTRAQFARAVAEGL